MIDATHLAGDLWIGSHPLTLGSCCGEHNGKARRVDELAREGFEVVVLCAQEWQPEIPGVETIHAPFDDDHTGLDRRQLGIAERAAEQVAERLGEGKVTLSSCWQGRNRSGLVAAMALSAVTGRRLGDCSEFIRSRREGSLTNMSFRQILHSSDDCELCEARRITKRYHEDAICWVADCKQCGPGQRMVVYRLHGITPSSSHMMHMIEMLRLCCPPRRGGYVIDDSMLSIPDHWHAHARSA